MSHVMMHFHNEPHHHHEDGSVQTDNSTESINHVQADSCANFFGVVPTDPRLTVPEIYAAAPLNLPRAPYDSVVLAGPEKPPRSPS